jgi:hypothetical protein
LNIGTSTTSGVKIGNNNVTSLDGIIKIRGLNDQITYGNLNDQGGVITWNYSGGNGELDIIGFSQEGSGGVSLYSQNTNAVVSAPVLSLYAQGGNITVPGNINGGTLTSTSDYRLKENIEYNVSLDITRLKPCYYNFINDKEHKIGFIAHEVQEIIPEAVIGLKDGIDHDSIVPQRIDYNVITAASIHSIQNLIKNVADLENRIGNIETNYTHILEVNEHLLKENNDLKSNIIAIQSRIV